MEDTKTKTYEGGTSFSAKKTNVPYQDRLSALLFSINTSKISKNGFTTCSYMLITSLRRKQDVNLLDHLCVENAKGKQ
ncbi:hypothetical protein MXB_5466 [Myxobolus squamalis]|nr:hypothetical protein MXB_5466 [Myxobolus squamalis]